MDFDLKYELRFFTFITYFCCSNSFLSSQWKCLGKTSHHFLSTFLHESAIFRSSGSFYWKMTFTEQEGVGTFIGMKVSLFLCFSMKKVRKNTHVYTHLYILLFICTCVCVKNNKFILTSS